MMNRIAARVEQSLHSSNLRHDHMDQQAKTPEIIGQAAAHAALSLRAKAILASTMSGYTAKMISKYRPQAPILAVTCDQAVQRQLSLIWGVHALWSDSIHTTDEMIQNSVIAAKNANLIAKQDVVIITAGVPVGEVGTTNLLKVHIVE
jgi:pyruvate kinase